MIWTRWTRTALLIGLSVAAFSMGRSAVASPVRNEKEATLEKIQAEARGTDKKLPRYLVPGSQLLVHDGEFSIIYTVGELVYIITAPELKNIIVDKEELDLRRRQQGGYLNTRGGRWTLVGVGAGVGAAVVLGIIWVERGAPAPWDW